MNRSPRQSPVYLLLWHAAAVALIALCTAVATGKPYWLMLPLERLGAGLFVGAYLLSIIWPSWKILTLGNVDKRIAYLLTIGIFIAAYIYASNAAPGFRPAAAVVPLLVALVLLPFLCRGAIRVPHVGLLGLIAAAGWYAAVTVDDGGKFFKYSAVKRSVITTAFYNLSVQEYEYRFPKRKNHAGGITILGDRYVVVNGDGELYLLNPDFDARELNLQRLAYDVPIFSDPTRKRMSAGTQDQAFRATDVLAEPIGDEYRIYVSHYFWDEARACHVLRISALQAGIDALLDGAPAEWEVVHDTQPCLPIEMNGKPFFFGNEGGGRLAVYDEQRLLLTVGHQKLHALQGVSNHSQDPNTSYGKIWLIDKDGDGAEIFSLGHRNPQGLYVDEQSNIWSTEHGPEGGDELNLVRQGGNYGWPFVTYGTDYGKFSWGLSKTQGRHDGYTQPVFAFVPSPGISNLIRIKGTGFPVWKDDLLVASLKAGKLFRVALDANRAVVVEPIEIGSRLRDLVEGSDGRVVIWADGAKIIVLEPASVSDDPDALFSAMCSGCHGIDGAGDKLGPDLKNIVNRSISSLSDYEYSAALSSRDDRWTPENLEAFLADPQVFAPGNKMELGPVEDPELRKTLVEYLQQN